MWQREVFRTILDEENLRLDREGLPRTAYGLRHTLDAAAINSMRPSRKK
jgi:hypothetical protein